MRLQTLAALGGLFLSVLPAPLPAGAGEQVGVRRASFTADGTATIVGIRQVRRAVLDCRGTWGGGTLAAEVSVDGANFVAAEDAAGPIGCSADCAVQLIDPGSGPFTALRLSLSGAGAPAINCTVLLASPGGK